MIYVKGTKIKINKIKKRDYIWLDGQFDFLSEKLNGNEGTILSNNKSNTEYGERETYQVLVNGEEFEIELDEFVLT